VDCFCFPVLYTDGCRTVGEYQFSETGECSDILVNRKEGYNEIAKKLLLVFKDIFLSVEIPSFMLIRLLETKKGK
jgi:Zn-finger protein